MWNAIDACITGHYDSLEAVGACPIELVAGVSHVGQVKNRAIIAAHKCARSPMNDL